MPTRRARDAAAHAMAALRDRAVPLLRRRGPQLSVVAGLVLVVGGAATFAAVLDAVQELDDIAMLDEPVLRVLVALRSPPVTAVLGAVSVVTGPAVLPVLVLVAAATWGLVAREWWQAGLLAAAMIVSTAVSLSLKAVIARPRPPVETTAVPGSESTYSFPSGHTIATATLLLVVGYLLWLRRPTLGSLVGWLVVAASGTLLVALSRLYLGYHFLTDVVASVGLAIAVLGGVVVVDRRRAARAADIATRDDPGTPGDP